MDKTYPIHLEDIYKLTGLSMEGRDVTQGFQGSGKNDRKKGELNLYDKNGTKWGGHRAHIDPINDEKVHCACYRRADKFIKNYSRGECTLDAISIVEFYKQGAPLNLCKYLLIEMLQVCASMHELVAYFIHGYLLVAFTMSKLKMPQGRELSYTSYRQDAKMFDPWHARTAIINTTNHNNAFTHWYNNLISTT